MRIIPICKTHTTKVTGLVFVLLLLTASAAFGQQARLQAKLDKLLLRKDVYPWKVSVLAVQLNSGRTIFASRETRPLMPASNMKLVVTAAALSHWGADHEFVTTLARRGKNLVLVGSGDPGFAEPGLLAKYNQNPTSVFRNWAAKVKQAGLSEVSDIIIDDTIFDRQFIHPNWPANQLKRWYTAPVGGLNLWENSILIKRRNLSSDGDLMMLVEPAVSYPSASGQASDTQRQVWISGGPGAGPNYAGGVASRAINKPIITTVSDPAVFFGSVFKAVLTEQSIPVRGQVVRRRVTDANGQLESDLTVLARTSTKLTDIIDRANKHSRSLFAECLFKNLGAAPGQQGSWTSGAAAVREFLTSRAGARADQFVIDDGSGLSRRNLISPAALVAVLKYMHNRKEAEVFRNSLSIWGRDGTLRNRSSKSDLAGKLFAKTGYINGVYSLSGYIRTNRGNWIAFSILMNQATNGVRARGLQEDICELLVDQ